MKRIALAFFIPLVIVLIGVAPARAGVIYCKADPVVAIGGTLVDIQVGMPLEYEKLVNGDVQIEIQLPEGVARELILAGVGFNGYGMDVVFTDSDRTVEGQSIPTYILVRVPIDQAQLDANETVPVEVTITPANALPLFFEGEAQLTRVELAIKGT